MVGGGNGDVVGVFFFVAFCIKLIRIKIATNDVILFEQKRIKIKNKTLKIFV